MNRDKQADRQLVTPRPPLHLVYAPVCLCRSYHVGVPLSQVPGGALEEDVHLRLCLCLGGDHLSTEQVGHWKGEVNGRGERRDNETKRAEEKDEAKLSAGGSKADSRLNSEKIRGKHSRE